MKELIQGFTETLTAGIEKVASAYGIPEYQHTEFIEKVAEEFERSLVLNGMEKEASFASGFGSAMKGAFSGTGGGIAMGTAALGVGGALASGAISGLASMAVNKVSKGFGMSSNRAAYDLALQKAIRNSEILQNDPQKAKMMGDSIFGFAPTVAADSNVLTNILVNAIHGDSIDLQTIRAVAELEEKLTKMNR